MSLLNLLSINTEHKDKIKMIIQTSENKITKYAEIPEHLKDESKLTSIKRGVYLTELACKELINNKKVYQVKTNYKNHKVEVITRK